MISSERQRGFSLMEAVIASLITASLILVGVEAYQFIQQSAPKTQKLGNSLARQNFMRDQIYSIDSHILEHLSISPAALFTSNRIRLISQNSARYGKKNLPVIAEYVIEKNKIIYAEVPLSRWYAVNDQEKRLIRRQIETPHQVAWQDEAWKETLLDQYSQIAFDFWDPERKNFVNQWTNPKLYPLLIRITFTTSEEKTTWHIKLPILKPIP